MDDFRSNLTTAVDELTTAGKEPVLLVVELVGIEDIKRTQGIASFEKFRTSAAEAVSGAAEDCATFTYGETRIGALLPGYARLKTFALIERLKRALPLLAQSYDCTIAPEFDLAEYSPETGVAGLVNYLIQLSKQDRNAA